MTSLSVGMTRVLFVTANVGSLFEDEQLMRQWIQTFSKRVCDESPAFLALHCQEIGGKVEKRVPKHLFFGALLQSCPQLESARIFSDDDNDDKFTALSSVYLWCSRDCDAHLWNFSEKRFFSPKSQTIVSSQDFCCEKFKFPEDICSEARHARKGFMRTRWRINRVTMDLVNVHLFHDACNIQALEEPFPSRFARIRRSALQWTLSRVKDDSSSLLIFGDFNFRVDSRALMQSLTTKETTKEDDRRLLFDDNCQQPLLIVAKKRFQFREKNYFLKNFKTVLNYDLESREFPSLSELPIGFPPSYPFGEDSSSASSQYMETRCPSWCDRVFMSLSARSLLSNTKYSLIGSTQPMGDHKPVSLSGVLNARFVLTTKGVFRETLI